jgi:hypothetical protein
LKVGLRPVSFLKSFALIFAGNATLVVTGSPEPTGTVAVLAGSTNKKKKKEKKRNLCIGRSFKM